MVGLELMALICYRFRNVVEGEVMIAFTTQVR
jgi:hypothetical protein